MADFTISYTKSGVLPFGGLHSVAADEARGTAVVYNRSAAPLWVRADGVNPSVTGANDGDHVVPANSSRTFALVAEDYEIRIAGVLGQAYTVEVQ